MIGKKQTKSLGLVILRYVLSIYTIITFFITIILLKNEYDTIQNRIVENMIMMEKNFYESFSQALWSMDRIGIKSLISGLVQGEGVSGLKFTLTDKSEFSTIGNIPKNNEKNNEKILKFKTNSKISGKGQMYEIHPQSAKFFDYFIENRFELWIRPHSDGEEKLVGFGSIYSTNQIIIEKVKHGFYIIIVSSVIKTIIIWVLFLIVISIVVSKPLTTLTRSIISIDPSKPISDDNLLNSISVRKDELGVLANTFQYMIGAIHDNIVLINDLNSNLEKKVELRTKELMQKNRDIEIILVNIKQGIFTFDESNLIHPHYAKYLESIFETQNIAGVNPIEFLFSKALISNNDLDQMKAIVNSCIGMDDFAFSVNKHLLLKKYSIQINPQTIKIIELDWNIIIDTERNIIEKIMVVVRDVSEIEKLEAEIQKSTKELSKIGQILAIGPEKFIQFYEKSTQFLKENKEFLSKQIQTDEIISILFRNLHTIKGNARTLALSDFVNHVHDVEQLHQNIRDKKSPWDFPLMEEKHNQIAKELQIYWELLTTKLKLHEIKGNGRSERDENNEKLVQLLMDKVNNLNFNTDDSLWAKALREIWEFKKDLGNEYLKKLLEDELISMEDLAVQLGKKKPHFHFDEKIKFDKNKSSFLKDVFVHLLRNSLDHGLENAQIRLANGKEEQGNVMIKTYIKDKDVFVHINDDGKGLNLQAIKSKSSVQLKSDEEYADLIFKSGMSTATQVTEISGRGVGLDAVRGFLEKKGGSIYISFLDKLQNKNFRPFEFVIRIPLDQLCS